MNPTVDQIVVTAIITAACLVLVQGLVKKFFSKGAIVDSIDCGKNRELCLQDRNKELQAINTKLGDGEKIFKRMELAAKIQAMALIEICKELKLDRIIVELEDFVKGRGEFKE